MREDAQMNSHDLEEDALWVTMHVYFRVSRVCDLVFSDLVEKTYRMVKNRL